MGYVISAMIDSSNVLATYHVSIIIVLTVIYVVAPMAPHGQFTFVNGDPENIQTEPPVPAARHANLFKDVKSMWITRVTLLEVA